MSGGSITNAYVGLRTDLFLAGSGDFRTDIRPLARAVSVRGTLWRSPLTYAYLLALVTPLALATILCFPLEGLWPFVAWVVALAAAGWLARQRGWVAAKAFDRALFRREPLSRLNPSLDHVICACDLQAAENVYFSGRFAYSYRLGWGVPGDLLLARAVQASAALPGAFAPTVLPLGRHRFGRAGATGAPRRLVLTDGGVYDNMGTQWSLNLASRVREGAAPQPPPHLVDEVVVVNASAGADVKERGSVTVPVLGELTSLLAVKDVLYDQTTAVRRRLLNARYVATRAGVTDPDVALRGGTVQIDASPYDLPEAFARGSDDLARRARAALAALTPAARQAWSDDAEANSRVKTTLSKIPADRAARLMRHAYVLTMVNMHVLHDYPLLDVPTVEDFGRLLR